jgi:hypothetical protein
MRIDFRPTQQKTERSAMTEEPFYEVAITRDPIGLSSGIVYYVTMKETTEIGRTNDNNLRSMGERAVIAAAKRIARAHREGVKVIRLDLDGPPE